MTISLSFKCPHLALDYLKRQKYSSLFDGQKKFYNTDTRPWWDNLEDSLMYSLVIMGKKVSCQLDPDPSTAYYYCPGAYSKH
jgi:hypothetical protein